MDEARRVATQHLGGGTIEPLGTAAATPKYNEHVSTVTCLSDVYNVRKLIVKQFSSHSKEPFVSLSCNGSSYYLCEETLKGGSDFYYRAVVLQWINFADFTLWPCISVKLKSPKFDTKSDAFRKLIECLKYLNHVLESKTFLVYHKLSFADIAVLTCLVPLLHSEAELKKVENDYVNLYRWFKTVRNSTTSH